MSSRDAAEPVGSVSIASRAASAATLLMVRRVILMVISAGSTAVAARYIGVGAFGIFAAAQALNGLFSGFADFGFSIVLSREMAHRPSDRARLMGTALFVAGWGGLLAGLGMVVIGLATGATSERSVVLYILAVPQLATGVSTYRQSFMVTYRVRQLAMIDVTTNVLQSVLTIIVAIAGGGLIGVSIVFSATSVVNSLGLWVYGRRIVGSVQVRSEEIRAFLRASLPLGLASFFASIYFTIDLILLTWLTSKGQTGDYAAAVKFLNLLVEIPGFVVAAVMPGLSSLRDDPKGRSELVARIWHWLVAFGLPVCVGGALFASPVVRIFFGPHYAGAVPMFRILCGAAAVSLISNVFGVVLNSMAIARWQVVQNLIAIVFNIVANVILVPRYGAIASAWLTLATELIVCTGSFLALRHRISFAPALQTSIRPMIAILVSVAFALALAPYWAIAIPVAAVVFIVALILFRGWPVELAPRLGRRRDKPSEAAPATDDARSPETEQPATAPAEGVEATAEGTGPPDATEPAGVDRDDTDTEAATVIEGVAVPPVPELVVEDVGEGVSRVRDADGTDAILAVVVDASINVPDVRLTGVPTSVYLADDPDPAPSEPDLAALADVAKRRAVTVAGLERGRYQAFIGIASQVVLDGRVVGPPADAAGARRLLSELSGSVHQLRSAVAVVSEHGLTTADVVTDIWLRRLSPAAIDRYVATGEWVGRHAAYDPRGEGRWLIARVDGDLQNLRGWPYGAVMEAFGAHLARGNGASAAAEQPAPASP